MSTRKIFISFDYEHDKKYKYLLNAWDENTDFEFTFDDRSPSEIQTDSVSVVKQVLSRKINESSTVIVLAGEYINSLHKDRNEIGCINWQNYEVSKALELGKKIIVIKLNYDSEIPKELNGYFYTLVKSFDQKEILNAIRVPIG